MSCLHLPVNNGLNTKRLNYPRFNPNNQHTVNKGDALWLQLANDTLIKIHGTGIILFSVLNGFTKHSSINAIF